ncbi:Gfo/Idh/MocA family protein [Quadrisphaera oryzae]|uniref:Gfo/Idh/MocA family protein n=1 Tax=Quadrisphaera TaxID=317661 RepID=UPI00351CB22B
MIGNGSTGRSDALRVVQVGAGAMGGAWLSMVAESADVELVGLVDLDLDAARRQLAERGHADVAVGTDAVALASETGATAVLDITVPGAHHPVTTAALFAGLPVLGEKPCAATLAQSLSLVAAAEVSEKLFMVSQSRRWNPQLWAYRDLLRGLGGVGLLQTDFFKAPHFGGFRDAMDHPLLVDMAIHQFDMARFLLGTEPVSVTCEEWNPSWSWYAGDASATAVFEFTGGARYVFNGSWCAPGAETSWNGVWRAGGEKGSALWDGDHEPTVDVADSGAAVPEPGARLPHDGIGGALAVFVDALRTGTTPQSEVHENVLSQAMVEAAVEAAAVGHRVQLDDVLTRAWEQAVEAERREDVREQLRSWTSVRSVLGG